MWHPVWNMPGISKITSMKQITLQQDPNQAYTWNTEFSGHSLQRSQQRGIDRNLIYLAMDYSMTFFKQGLIFMRWLKGFCRKIWITIYGSS